MDDYSGVPAKKLEIVKLAYDKFYDGGFHATAMDSVMAESGISKRTLYKYFSSKEELIEAVMDYYSAEIIRVLYDRALETSADPREQILATFDLKASMMQGKPTHGCLGLMAAQEYVGKHIGIEHRGKMFAEYAERHFVEICKRGRFAPAEGIGEQVNILFQGSILLAQILGNTSPIDTAKAAVELLLSSGPQK